MSTLSISMIVIALTTYFIRATPIVAFQKKIENLWVQDFIYYIPFCVLAAMTFPDVFYSTTPAGEESPHLLSGIIATIVALILAWRENGLVAVAIWAVVAAIAVEEICLLFF